MASKGKKSAPPGGKGKKAPGAGKGSAPGVANPIATFEDDDMYQEPIKKVNIHGLRRLSVMSVSLNYDPDCVEAAVPNAPMGHIDWTCCTVRATFREQL